MEFKQYLGKLMVAWLWYNPAYEERFGNTNVVCYIYPRLLINDAFEEIHAEEDFPENGRMEVFIQGGQSAKEIFEKFGPLVSVRLNREIAPNYKGHNRYRLSYNPQAPSFSDLTIERLSGKKFFQVLETGITFEAFRNSRVLYRLDEKPLIEHVLVKIGETLYGPFEYAGNEERLFLKGIQSRAYQAQEYPWGDCAGALVKVKDNEGTHAASILPAEALSAANAGQAYDWISDEQLILSLAGVLKAGDQSARAEVGNLAATVEKLAENNEDVSLTEERKARLRTLSEDIAGWNELADAVLSEALSDEAMLDKLSALAVERHLDQIKEKISENEEVRGHMAAQRESLRKEVEDLQRREAELRQNVAELQRQEADFHSHAPRQEPRESGAALEELERRIYEARVQYDYERAQKDRLDASLSALIRRYKDEAGQIVRLFDRKILDGLLDAPSPAAPGTVSAPAVPAATEPPRFHPALLHPPISRDELIDRVGGYLGNRAGRVVRRNDVVNYLLCLSLGFVTVFAGKPGSGKTTLCELLAKSLGLATGDAQNRYVEVPVERGWTSPRDLIGALNPETNALNIRNMELWEALTRLDREFDPAVAYPPFLILLDEANLSPIEHYWSAFLRNCDFNASGRRCVSVGGGKSWALPEHLRFLATVNFDHTTEKLSARFLDRAWVVTLDASEVSGIMRGAPENLDGMTPYRLLREAFPPAEVDAETEAKWNALRDIFHRRGLSVTPRSVRMVYDYCAAACVCMSRDAPGTRLAPLDYAFSQKILPSVSGQGENYRELLYDLRRECGGELMPLTARHLERMQRSADSNHGFYQFF